MVKGARAVPGQNTADLLASLPGESPKAIDRVAHDREELDPPLKGVKVLEIANIIAGPVASKMLADLGAEVVKLEPLDGDISRPIGTRYFYYLNANKRSVSVNTRTPEGKEVLRRLTARSDILVANMRPGATERMGIGAGVLRELNPGLVETHITAFGWEGPLVHRPGMDPQAQAMMGLQREQGGQGNPPVYLAQLAPSDYTAGAIGALGALMALFVRQRTGLAQRVHTNLLNGAMVLSSEAFTRYDGCPPRRAVDKWQYGIGALHRLYETEDGWIYVAAETEDEWLALCNAMDRDGLPRDVRFVSVAARDENDAALAEELAPIFTRAGSDRWLSRLRREGVPSARVVEGYDKGFFSDPDIAAGNRIVTLQHPTLGRFSFAGNAIGLRDTGAISVRPTPLLGEHTGEVLREAGYSQRQIEELFDKGVMKREEHRQATDKT
jgi:crotonobetainyl-CoA:carnitine CoA-transferase CaiB-like acyl-CoA transferase